MTFPALDEAKGKLELKRKELGTIFSEAGQDMDFTKVKSFRGTTHEIAAHVRKLNDEQTDLAKEYENLCAVEKAANASRHAPDLDRQRAASESQDGPVGSTKGQKSLGEMFTESVALKQRSGPVGPTATLDVGLKTVLSTTAGFAPEILRTGQVVPFATRPIQIADVIPTTTTTQAAVQYMEETTFTNVAAEIDEGLTYQEATLAYTERLSTVRKIGVFLPVTDEQLEDVAQARGMIDNRLPFMIRQKLDAQIISGTGVGTNPTQLRGIMNVVGIQTQAKGADPTPDAVYKAIVKVEVTGQAFANLVVMHPNNWQDIRLLRTADGLYIWGNPSDTGPERIWGLQVVRAQAATQGTAVVGDFANFSELAIRHGIDMQVSNSHASFFINGTQAVRADIRVAVVFYRPAAFCTVTGL